MIRYVMKGKAGKMAIPANVLLFVQNMRENLKLLHYTNSKDTKEERLNVWLTMATFGSVSI